MKKLYAFLTILILGAITMSPSDDIIAAFPLWLIPVLGTALGAVGDQVKGNPRNVRKTRRDDLNATTDQADVLFNKQMGNVGGSMNGIDEAIAQLGEQYGDMGNMSKGMIQNLRKNYMDTPEGSAIMGRINQNTEKSKNKLRNDSSLMNLSEEAYMSGIGNINQAEGDATSGLASNANNHRQGLRGSIMRMQNMMGANASTRAGLNLNKANFKSGLYGNSFGAASGIMNQTDQRMQNNANQMNEGMSNASNAIMQALMASGGVA